MSLPHTFFVSRGGSSAAFEWAAFQTGDSYQGGIIVRTATTMAVQYYPESRKTLGFTQTPVTKTAQFQVAGQSGFRIYGVGGGAGGFGANGSAGGGGGAFSVGNLISAPNGSIFDLTIGHGGLGGIVSSSPVMNYFGVNNFATSGGQTEFTWAGFLELYAQGATVGTPDSNTSIAANLSQGGSASSNVNNVSAGVDLGTGGRGGNRNYGPTPGINGGAGAGGGNTNGNPSPYFDTGSAGSGRFGGGGGGGSAPLSNASRTGGAGGTNAFAGGLGGSVDPPQYGSDGLGVAGGRAYLQIDPVAQFGQGLNRGSAGGGGFPGGGGGSSWYGGSLPDNTGVGADGASGLIHIEWDI